MKRRAAPPIACREAEEQPRHAEDRKRDDIPDADAGQARERQRGAGQNEREDGGTSTTAAVNGFVVRRLRLRAAVPRSAGTRERVSASAGVAASRSRTFHPNGPPAPRIRARPRCSSSRVAPCESRRVSHPRGRPRSIARTTGPTFRLRISAADRRASARSTCLPARADTGVRLPSSRRFQCPRSDRPGPSRTCPSTRMRLPVSELAPTQPTARRRGMPPPKQWRHAGARERVPLVPVRASPEARSARATCGSVRSLTS